MPDSLHLAKQSLSYAKLVANPTETSWSQVYNAGNLFACLSLAQTEDSGSDKIAVTGKAIINNLEAEFFTLEEKSLESIKKAIKESLKDLPENITLSFSLAFFKETLLYVFIVGAGKIVIKRDESIGTLLEQKQTGHKEILSASGRIHNNDCLIIQTEQFAQHITTEKLTQALDVTLPNDIADSLSLQLHEHDDGGQAAIIIVAQGVAPHEAPIAKTNPQEETLADAIREEEVYEKIHLAPEDAEKKSQKSLSLPKLHLPPMKLPHLPFMQSNTSSKKKTIMAITAVLIIFLIGSIIMTKQNQDQTKKQTYFKEQYATAQRNYEEGKALANLNPELSREDFQKAQTTITQAQKEFTSNSKEYKQLDDLLSKVKTELGGTTPTDSAEMVTAKQVNDDASALLTVEKTTSGDSFAQDETKIYSVTKKGVSAINKDTEKTSTIIANDNDWKNTVAIAPYQGNIYLLDTQEGVLKFVAGGEGFGKSAYFKGDAPNLTNAVAMAIDSSIWILTKNGKILKYTSGTADTFTVVGIDKPFSNPSKIITTKDMTGVYILDKGNSRIVALNKKGAFQKAYPAAVIAQAKDFDIFEKEKKAIILSGGKLWELPL